jgi:3-hydroxyisobutyrate dehydrogenase-like beta-hydroxyacid dehydrogenase
MPAVKTAFIGLGVMGYPMAGHLARAGNFVTVYNRTAAKADAWVGEYGGASAPTPAKAAEGADFVFSCVGNDDDLKAVALGRDGILTGMIDGAVYVDHTTASANVAREIGAAARRLDRHFLDGPVSGGQAGAEGGKLTVMVGGDPEPFERALPVIRAYGHAVTLMGGVGAGQLTKMVNQICVVGAVQGLAEGLVFAERAGLDAHKVIEVIAKGAAQSWQMENRGPSMADGHFNFGFATDWMAKDLDICIREAAINGSKLPVTGLILGYYRQLQEQGCGRLDSSCLIKLLH